jgi:hypothetical protein
MHGTYDAARQVFTDLKNLGISYNGRGAGHRG